MSDEPLYLHNLGDCCQCGNQRTLRARLKDGRWIGKCCFDEHVHSPCRTKGDAEAVRITSRTELIDGFVEWVKENPGETIASYIDSIDEHHYKTDDSALTSVYTAIHNDNKEIPVYQGDAPKDNGWYYDASLVVDPPEEEKDEEHPEKPREDVDCIEPETVNENENLETKKRDYEKNYCEKILDSMVEYIKSIREFLSPQQNGESKTHVMNERRIGEHADRPDDTLAEDVGNIDPNEPINEESLPIFRPQGLHNQVQVVTHEGRIIPVCSCQARRAVKNYQIEDGCIPDDPPRKDEPCPFRGVSESNEMEMT